MLNYKLSPQERIIFPLDVSSKDEALEWVERLENLVGVFKIGLELFTSCGPRIIEDIKKRTKHKIFLDLKLHDIPNTVSRTIKIISDLQVDWITVHTLSGYETLKKAVNFAYNNLKIVAVTIITSLDKADLMELGFNSELARDPRELVFKLAQIAHKAGCDGIVCSAREVSKIKEIFPEFITIVPGIRLENHRDDQVRTSTPYEAILAGADYLVIGRPIKEAFSPEEICKSIMEQIEKALKDRNDK